MSVGGRLPAASRPGPFALLFALLAAFVWVGSATYFVLRNPGAPAELYLGYAATGLTYLVAGVVGWWLRPNNRTGPLLVAIGVTLFIGHFYGTGVPPLDVLIVALASVHNAILVALLLAYPSGRLASWFDRGIVVVVAVTQVLGDLLTLVRPGEEISTVTGLIIPFVIIGRIAARWKAATPAARRTLAPVVFASTVLLLGIVVAQVPRALNAGQDVQDLVNYYFQFVTRGALPIAFLYGLLRLRMARSGVADVVVRLGDAPDPQRVRRVLSTALGDPSLQVVRWSRERGRFVDESGAPVELPTGPERAVTMLQRDGEPLAALVHDPVLLEDPELVHSVSAALRLAVDNERLQAEVQSQLEEVRASRARIVEAGDAERRRVERDLHDGAQQRLVSLSLALRLARTKLGKNADPQLEQALSAASAELSTALSELRELARGIHPAILTEAGLAPALQSLADRSTVPVEVRAELAQRFPAPVEATAYFLVSEALANAAKHANAGLVRVTAQPQDGELVVTIADDGTGGADPGAGSGLRGMQDRVAAVGGRVEITSRPSEGTTIVAHIPTAAA